MKQREGEVDREMASSMVDSVSDAARRVDGAGVFEAKGEHRSEHGYVQVTVRSKPSSLAKQVGCFVATACYGDESQPPVVVLRRFRDLCLLDKPWGRLHRVVLSQQSAIRKTHSEASPVTSFDATGALAHRPSCSTGDLAEDIEDVQGIAVLTHPSHTKRQLAAAIAKLTPDERAFLAAVLISNGKD